MQEREISLVDLFFEILLRWRMLIVWALCGAVLLGSFSYIKTWKAAEAQTAQVEAAKRRLAEASMQEEPDEMNSALLEETAMKLTVEQRRNVEMVAGYEKWLTSQEGSALLKIDANSVQQAEITFYITSESREKSYSIEAVYEDIISNGEMVQCMVDQFGESPYISDLISLKEDEPMSRIYSAQESVQESVRESVQVSVQVSMKDQIPTDSFSVRVIHYDEQMCSELAQAVIDFAEKKHNELEDKLGGHELVVVNVSHAVVYDSGLADAQQLLLNNIANVQDTVLKRKKDFASNEWQYYDVLVNGEVTGITSVNTVQLSPSDIVKRGITVTPGVSLKYVLLGMILAVFLYAFYVFFMYIINTKIRATDNLQLLYAIPQIGLIPAQKEKGKIFGFVDNFIDSLRNRNKRKFTQEEAVGLASVAVKMAVERQEYKSVYLLGCDLKGQALVICEQIRDRLNKDNIQAVILNNVLYDASAMDSLKNAGGAVLVEKAGSTLYIEIEQELELLKREDIKILGGVLVE